MPVNVLGWFAFNSALDLLFFFFLECSVNHPDLQENQLCLLGATATCSSDVGGPFVVYQKNVPLVAGVISLAGISCDIGKPFVVTDVQAFVPFVKNTMKEYATKKINIWQDHL